ncbi:MAG: ATP-dependent RecD-like DNA helicase [Puniceicoccaceae bacterium]
MSGGEELEGTLERILYADEDTGYCIGELEPKTGGARVVISGALPGVQCGETLKMEGTWFHHQKYGRQFKVAGYETRLPSTVNGIRRYLGSGLIEGIGKVYADKIAAYFGDETLEIISNHSARLREVPGIGKERAKSIKRAWDEQRHVREVMVFLHTYGVTARQSVRLVKRYGGEILTLLKTEPYRLADEVDGIGFKTADRIALNLGIASNGAARTEAGLRHILSTAEGEGHTAMDERTLIDETVALLEAGEGDVENGLARLLEAAAVVKHPDGLIQLKVLDRAERRLVRALRLVCETPSGLPSIRVDGALDWAEERAGFHFAAEQREGLRMALSSKISILTGGPGTGKTTILKSLVEILKAKKVRLLLGSPTGRAAQRLASAAGQPAFTLHRLLEFDPESRRFTRGEERPLKADFIIVDEASMLDLRLAASLLAAVPAEAHLLLVGDADQLPSVGAGNVLRDLVESGHLPVARLQRIFRQSRGSSITEVAHGILAGTDMLPATSVVEEGVEGGDLRFVRAPEPDACVREVLAIVDQLVEKGLSDPLSFQILVPMHKGTCGVQQLNEQMKRRFPGEGPALVVRGTAYSRGDKVIQLRNDYDRNIFNGDVGRVTGVDPKEETMRVDFGNGDVLLTKEAAGDLSLAFAMTIHKSQGSEYPVVIAPLVMQHYVMLRRNLLYTAVTRGKQNVWLVGDPRAFRMAIREVGGMERRTDLKRKLVSSLQGGEQ